MCVNVSSDIREGDRQVCGDHTHLALVCVKLFEMQQTLLGGITEDV